MLVGNGLDMVDLDRIEKMLKKNERWIIEKVLSKRERAYYLDLNGRENKLHNILTLQDDIGPFGSPFVDSVRTAVSENTTTALQVVFLRPSISNEDGQQLITSMGTMFTQRHGGDFNTTIIG